MSDLSEQLAGIARNMGYAQGYENPVLISNEASERIHELAQQGHKWTAIARILDEEGFPTPRRTGKWSIATIQASEKRYRPR